MGAHCHCLLPYYALRWMGRIGFAAHGVHMMSIPTHQEEWRMSSVRGRGGSHGGR